MSKHITVTSEYIAEVCREFEKALSTGKFPDGKISFTKTLGLINRKAQIFFTELAWLKMQTLIREYSDEVAWHGIAKRGEDAEKDEYYITDILVYPQEVTGATVNTDQEKYQMWLMNHEDDVFNNIRMQGHSHVNMGTSPSSVDNSLYERILDQLDDEMFYIFMIWNKQKQKTIKIYDLAKNVLFETNDITIEVLDDGTGIEKFLNEAKEMVVRKPAFSNSISSYKNGRTVTDYGTYKKEEPKTTISSTKKNGRRKGNNPNGGSSVNKARDAQKKSDDFSSENYYNKSEYPYYYYD